MRKCPEDSSTFFSTINEKIPREKSVEFNWYNLTRHMYFQENVTNGYELRKTSKFLNHIFSLSLWINVKSTSSIEIELISFGKKE